MHWIQMAGLVGALLVAIPAGHTQDNTMSTPPTGYQIAPGPYEPTDESFARSYKCPAWFRDAKLGIWAHWGPQAVPMEGDWYARQMYQQGGRQYEDHLKRFGHPAQFGWKDVIPLWKAEKWDPDRLMGLYKKAGAKYFVSMGVHHDNFDLWDSKYHRWNAVKMGPHRDVVGTWQKAAKKLGLKFGVSEHLGASFTWFQDSHKSDKTGPLAGISYDGANPEYQDLYHQPALPGDNGWYSTDPRWHQEWFNRIKDLVDHYQPDLLYTDGGVPFGNEVGRSLIAHLYNTSAERHGGRAEAIYTCKQESRGKWIQDLERGVMTGINPYPWQTDTSIGDWFYNRNWKFRGADWVIHMLVDIVAKNGNLLLNVVQRPDGTLDPEAEQVLSEMAKWIAVNGEAIYGTRPWLVHGEGPVRAKGGHFNEDYKYSARDVRFTTKGNTLYATALGWPEDGKLVIRSLANFPGVTGRITDVQVLGTTGKPLFTHDADGLTVILTTQKPTAYTTTLKITGANLRGFKPELAMPQTQAVVPDSAGNFTFLPGDAELHGSLQVENQGGQPNLGFWDSGSDYASWKVRLKEPGRYRVSASMSTLNPSSQFIVESGGRSAVGTAMATGGWDRFREIDLGELALDPGERTINVKPRDPSAWKAINLRWVKLTRAK